MSAKQRYDQIMDECKLEGTFEYDPVERLRFFCSIAFQDSEDWLDADAFFADIIEERDGLIEFASRRLRANLRIPKRRAALIRARQRIISIFGPYHESN